MKRVPCRFLPEDRDQGKILIYLTDNEEDVWNRIRSEGNHPSWIFAPLKGFSIIQYMASPESIRFLDLFHVFQNIKTIEDLSDPFVSFVRDYMSLGEYLEWFVFYEIYERNRNRYIESTLLSLRTLLQQNKDLFERFHTRLRDKDGILHNRTLFLRGLDTNWYKRFRREFIETGESIQRHNREAMRLAEELESTSSVPTLPRKILGRVVSFSYPTTEVSTGILFDRLRLHPDLPLARYKHFYKFLPGRLHEEESPKEEESETVLEFYSLRLYDASGRLLLYATNTRDGLNIQVLLEEESIFGSEKKVLDFLSLEEPERGLESTSVGIFVEYDIQNPPISKTPRWAAIQPALFANLCMNIPVFSKFVSVNDSDKISRQNNSLFLYFFSPLPSLTQTNVVVGNWGRGASRYGDATAIVTPIQPEAGDYRIRIRITRSRDEETLDRFVEIFSKLVQLYNEAYEDQLTLFQRRVPGYEPIDVQVPETTVLVETTTTTMTKKNETKKPKSGLTALEPRIFPSNIYARHCQHPKPFPISEQEASELPESRVLRFPPPENNKGFETRIYTCPTTPAEKDGMVYPYPGFIRLKRMENHPFGIAPCCFKEDHQKHNKKALDELLRETSKETTPAAIMTTDNSVVYLPKNLYRLRTEKIMENPGQLGDLPESLSTTLYALIPSSTDVFRIGMPFHWKKEPALACLEYRDCVLHGRSELRDATELRTRLADYPFPQVTRQENYDVGIEEIRQRIRDPSIYLSLHRYYRLLEEFYHVNIVWWCQDRSRKDIRVGTPRFVQTPAWRTDDSRPFVLLYQHYGSSSNATFNLEEEPAVELIGWSSPEARGVMELPESSRPAMRELLHLSYLSFLGDHANGDNKPPIMIRQLAEAQWIDPLGQTRLLFLTEAMIPLLLPTAVAPLALEEKRSLPDPLPKESIVRDLVDFLQDKIQKNKVYQQIGIFYLKNHGILLYQPSDSTTTSTIKYLPDELIGFLTPEDSSSRYKEWNQTKRFTNVLQDYMLILFSRFLRDTPDETKTMTIPEVVNLFMSVRLSFRKDFKQPEQISPLVIKNKTALFIKSEGIIKLRLPSTTRDRVRYFLTWFMTRSSKELESMHEFRELPSFYQISSDFRHPQEDAIIQTSSIFRDIMGSMRTPYLSTPLDRLDPPKEDSYYYSPTETPEPYPYLLLVCTTRQEILDRVRVYYQFHHQWTQQETFTYWLRKTTTWEQRGDPEIRPVFALYQKTKSLFYLLLPVDRSV